jgi:hypothetical protein
MAGFGISGVEPSDSATESVNLFLSYVSYVSETNRSRYAIL